MRDTGRRSGVSLDENPLYGNRATGADEAEIRIHPDAVAVIAPVAFVPSPSPSIALWWCTLDVAPAISRALEETLASGERVRAARFGSAQLREHYIVGRGSLRCVLGAILGIAAADVPITRGERGRPRLGDTAPGSAGVVDPAKLDFNISHTAGAALIGVASGVRIGVDIERRDRSINTAGIARKFLSPAERIDLGPLDGDRARVRALELWTCKEAMSKATGDALSAPFAAIDVELGNAPRLRGGPAPYVPAAWKLFSAAAPRDYFATIACWQNVH